MPAARRQSPEMGFRRRLVTQVKRLWIVFLCKLDHLFAGDRVAAEFGFGADDDIFEIDHAEL